MNRDTELAERSPDVITPSPNARADVLPFGIRWRDLLIALLAFLGDLVFLGLFATDLHSRYGGTPVSPAAAMVVVAVMAAALLWRWRAGLPVLVYVLTLTAGLILWVQEAMPVVCVLVALYSAARQASRRSSPLSLGLSLLTVAIVTAAVVSNESDRVLRFIDVAFPTGVVISVMLGVWTFARREHVAAHRAEALATQIDRGAELATQAERERIARELHDILAHSVAAMMMQAAGARALAQTVIRDQSHDERVQSIQESLASIETTGSQSMRELHRLLGIWLSAGTGTEPPGSSEPPGLEKLGELVATGRHSGLIVEVHRSGEPEVLDPSVGIAAYRTVQESLTNALKHLGRGAVVDVSESWDERQVQVQVRCRGGHDAVQMQAQQGGRGLQGLRERVELAGGVFEAGWVDEDFVTTAALPHSGNRSGAREDDE